MNSIRILAVNPRANFFAKIARIIVSRGPRTGSVMMSSWHRESLNIRVWTNATRSEQVFLFLSELWQRNGFYRGPKAVAWVQIMQTEGARRLSVATGAHRIIGRRWSPGLLATDFRFYLASRRQVLTPTFCDVRWYLNFRHFLSFCYAIILSSQFQTVPR